MVTLKLKMPVDTTKTLLKYFHRFKYMGFETNYS